MASVTEREIWTAVKLLTQRATIVTGTVTGNFFGGWATSGLNGQDLFTYGVAGQWWRLQEAYLRIFPGIWTWAAHVWIRAYLNLMGGETMVMNDFFHADGSDGDIALIYWFWESEIYGPLRIEVQSDNAGDINVTVPFEYRHKDW
jgi:hypothetical protein